jgi:hypothetical protein
MESVEKDGSFTVDRNGKIKICGKIALIHLTASVPQDEKRFDNYLAEALPTLQEEISESLTEMIKDELGDRFEANIKVKKGSLKVFLAIKSVVDVLIYYKEIVETIKLIVRQAKAIVKRIVERRTGLYVVVSGGLSPLSPILNARLTQRSRFSSSDVMLYYLIVSHAALLLLFAWIIVKQLLLI